jgi:hypothetical protein
VVLLLERGLVYWSLDIDERGEHENLHGSSRQSVIPYIHARTGVILLKLALPEPPFWSTPEKQRLSKLFITQGRTVTMSTDA